jgi:hypothetical protein
MKDNQTYHSLVPNSELERLRDLEKDHVSKKELKAYVKQRLVEWDPIIKNNPLYPQVKNVLIELIYLLDKFCKEGE